MNIKLLNAIKLSGLKQWQIARKANLSEVRLSKIVNESSKEITESEKQFIAKALNLPVGELFSFEETEYLTGNE
jgi:transcriptional regulator with XRE-family HTH domain